MKKIILILFLFVILFAGLGTISAATTERVSVADSQPNGDSYDASITPDGRYIAFASDANNIVYGDTNSASDVFVKDGWTGGVTRVSTSSTSGQSNGDSYDPVITPDGRYIAFTSGASNLVSGDTNGITDIFVKDGWTGQITRVSTNSTGGQSNSVSYEPVITPDGRYIAFVSGATNLVSGDTNGVTDIFVKDGWTGAVTRISTTPTGGQSNGESFNPVITPDGRYITFYSWASNLVSGDTNGNYDVFVKDGWTGAITRVSTTSTGAQATGGSSYNPSITPDGRYITFESYATNLISGDTNSIADIFVKDGWTGQITRVSTTATGAQATGGDSWNPVITPDGRYITFYSWATNLVSGDTNGVSDVFVKDGWTGAITRISTSISGGQATGGNSHGSSITPDGRYITFESYATNLVSGDTNGYSDVFVKDGWTGRTVKLSTSTSVVLGNSSSGGSVITPDGRYIAFNSYATNLVSDDTNESLDVFMHDRVTGRTIRVSTTATGAQAISDDYWGSSSPSITPDGRYIAFDSDATNLVPGDTNGYVDVFVKDVWTGAITRVSTTSTGAQALGGGSYSPSITPDGRYIAFESFADNLVSGDTNIGYGDVFVKDGWTGQIIKVSTTSTGAQANGFSGYPSITPDGRYIVFHSWANLVSGDTNGEYNVFVKDGWTGQITRVSTTVSGAQANEACLYPFITPNGRYVTFESNATNLVPGDTNGDWDVFIKDSWTGAITLVSRAADGTQGNNDSGGASITPDGRYIVFSSSATNLVGGDTNGECDIFVKDGWTGQITRVSVTATGEQTNDASVSASITPDGRYIIFDSWATNIFAGDTNERPDVFVRILW